MARNGAAVDEVGAPVCGLRGAWSLGGGEGDGDGELRESRERVELAIGGDDEQGSFGWGGVVFWRGQTGNQLVRAAFGNTFYYLILSRLRKPPHPPGRSQGCQSTTPQTNSQDQPALSSPLSLPPLHSH